MYLLHSAALTILLITVLFRITIFNEKNAAPQQTQTHVRKF